MHPAANYTTETFGKLYRSTRFCALSAVGLLVACGIGVALATVIQRDNMDLAMILGWGGIGLGGIAVCLWIAACVMMLISLYKSWNLIQDEHAATSPGAAIGLLFVPFFNLYWAFVAIPGLAASMNRYRERYNIKANPASVGLGIAYCVLVLTSIVPIVGVLTSLVALAIFVLFTRSVCNTATAIVEAGVPHLQGAAASGVS